MFPSLSKCSPKGKHSLPQLTLLALSSTTGSANCITDTNFPYMPHTAAAPTEKAEIYHITKNKYNTSDLLYLILCSV